MTGTGCVALTDEEEAIKVTVSRGSMVGSDRLNVPAIDNSSHYSSSTAKFNQCTRPLLGWGAPLCKIQRGVAVSSVGHLCACPLLLTLANNLNQYKQSSVNVDCIHCVTCELTGLQSMALIRPYPVCRCLVSKSEGSNIH